MSDLIEREDVIDAICNKCMLDHKMERRMPTLCRNCRTVKMIQAIPSARPKGMTKEIHDINTRALDFVVELIDYICDYPNDDYMTTECLCRKLLKHGLIDKVDGYYEPKYEQSGKE